MQSLLQLVIAILCLYVQEVLNTNLVGLGSNRNSHPKSISLVEGNEVGNLKHIYTTTDPEIQQRTVREALKRILGDRSSEILLSVDPSLSDSVYRDAFVVSYSDLNATVIITGTTGVATLYGLNDYLKYHCQALISWEGNQLNLPRPLPQVTYQRTVVDRFRYYQNVCTDSYSFVWWDWPRWEKEIDWMALHGVNMPLAFTGQEEIWKRVYRKIGLSEDDIANYITGPAFLAWWRMGNINKWGGPIPPSFMGRKLDLLHKILTRMRNFGMVPVLPAFAGNVPSSIRKIYPNATLIEHPSWNHFNESYATYMLQPTDPLFQEIGKRFMKEMIDEVGTNHIYSCDTFNENDPKENSSLFLRSSAQATYNAMASIDPKSVWLMQSWVFHSTFWQSEQVSAYLGGVDHGNALILDLEAERNPLYGKFKNFFGHNFIWCMLQNFGGTMNTYGALDLVNNGITLVRESVPSDKFLGVGSCPEGINQNSVIFDFIHETSLQLYHVNISEWIAAYAIRRYGVKNDFIQEAWSILRNGVYNAPANIDNHGRSVIVRRPTLKLSEPIWYDQDDIRKVLGHFIPGSDELRNSSLYNHDLVDVTRQFLQLLLAQTYNRMIISFKAKKIENFEKHSKQLSQLLDDLERILHTNEKFLLGPWVKNAESWGENEHEKGRLRYNALNQITMWGPNGEIVDYAAKQWAGSIKNYYKPRWMTFIQALNSSLVSGEPYNPKRFRKSVMLNVEIPFTLSKQAFPVSPRGSSIKEATKIHARWTKLYMKYCERRRKQI